MPRGAVATLGTRWSAAPSTGSAPPCGCSGRCCRSCRGQCRSRWRGADERARVARKASVSNPPPQRCEPLWFAHGAPCLDDLSDAEGRLSYFAISSDATCLLFRSQLFRQQPIAAPRRFQPVVRPHAAEQKTGTRACTEAAHGAHAAPRKHVRAEPCSSSEVHHAIQGRVGRASDHMHDASNPALGVCDGPASLGDAGQKRFGHAIRRPANAWPPSAIIWTPVPHARHGRRLHANPEPPGLTPDHPTDCVCLADEQQGPRRFERTWSAEVESPQLSLVSPLEHKRSLPDRS